MDNRNILYLKYFEEMYDKNNRTINIYVDSSEYSFILNGWIKLPDIVVLTSTYTGSQKEFFLINNRTFGNTILALYHSNELGVDLQLEQKIPF